MSKFSVGETVWVKPFEKIEVNKYPNFTNSMKDYCERVYIVRKILEDGCIVLSENSYRWNEKWLESEEEHQMRVNGKEKEEKKEETKMVKLKDLRPGTIFHYYRDKLVKVSMQIGNFILCIKMNDGSPAVLDENVYVEHDIPVPFGYVEEELIESAKKAVNTFGTKQQMRHTQEECAELIVAISHWFRNREDSEKEVAEELADVIIMCAQMTEAYESAGYSMEKFILKKLDKLNSQIAEKEKKK